MDDHAIDLWARFLDEDLSSSEKAEIELSLCADELFRESVMDDLELDGMLRSLDEIDSTADEFVAQVAATLTTHSSNTEVIAPPRSRESNGQIKPGRTSDSNVEPPPIIPTNRATAVLATDERQRGGFARAQTLAICAAALVVLLLAGTIALVTASRNSNIADDHGRNDGAGSSAVVESVPEPSFADNLKTPKIIEDASSTNSSRDDTTTENPFKSKPVRDEVPAPVRPSPRTIVERPSRDQQPTHPQNSPVIVARLVETTGAVWESEPRSELTNAPLRLLKGAARLLMGNGATVNVHGPSEFQLASTQNVVLTRGRLSATVPQQAIGFTVNTPSSRIVDLGTEFDVSVEDDGATAVRVRRGEVQFATLPEDGSEGEQWNLSEGQFKLLTNDGTAHDWNIAMIFDVSGYGTVMINGEKLYIDDTDDFSLAQRQVMDEFAKSEREFISRTDGRRKESFRGLVSINDRNMKFETPTQFRTVRRITGKQLDRLGKLFRSLDSDNGTVEINGKKWSFNSREEFDNAQKEFNESFRDFFNGMGLPVPNN